MSGIFDVLIALQLQLALFHLLYLYNKSLYSYIIYKTIVHFFTHGHLLNFILDVH